MGSGTLQPQLLSTCVSSVHFFPPALIFRLELSAAFFLKQTRVCEHNCIKMCLGHNQCTRHFQDQSFDGWGSCPPFPLLLSLLSSQHCPQHRGNNVVYIFNSFPPFSFGGRECRAFFNASIRRRGRISISLTIKREKKLTSELQISI